MQMTEMTNIGRIMVRVDPDLASIVPGYIANKKKDLLTIREALNRADFETARLLGHSMKGSGGGYGFDEISSIGRRIEAAAKSMDARGISESLETLGEYLERLEVEYD